MSESIRYKVFFTPRITDNTYGDEIDVSDYIDASGVGSLKRSIDSADYGFGVYTIGDVTLKGKNLNGLFNDQNDSRSMFPSGRDLTRVRVEFHQDDFLRDYKGDILDVSNTTTITYKGLINDEATRLDIVTDTIRFKVLSSDSVIKKSKVPAGVVASGSLASTAIKSILDRPPINNVLNVDASNINVDLDITIDSGEFFNDLETKAALDELMFITNSVLLIDESDNILIQSRDENEDTEVINLFGKNDLFRRENIMRISRYNTGLHRMFNNIIFNNRNAENSAIQGSYGAKTKKFSKNFITDDTTEQLIADRLLEEFQAPKIELDVQVPTSEVINAELLDRVSVSYPLRVKPKEGNFLPIVGTAKIDDAVTPLPDIFGSIAIDKDVAFKIIEIKHNPKNFTTNLKLRQKGTTLSDGTFSEPGGCIVGFNKIDDATICDGGTGPSYNPSVVGAAQVNVTLTE